MLISSVEAIFRALNMEIAADLRAPFIARDSLIAMKRESGRPQDIAALEELHKISNHTGNDEDRT